MRVLAPQRLLRAGLTALGLAWASGTVHAQGFDQLAPLAAADLAQTRAGYMSVNGVNFTFGASLQTFVDGKLALSTTLSLDGDNQVSRTASAVGDLGSAFASPAGIGLTLVGSGGVTTLLQGVGGDALRNLVTTSASDQSIRQATNLNITLSGFETNQAQYAASQTMRTLNDSLGFALAAAPR